MYSVIRRMLFWFPAEGVHYFSMNILMVFCRIPFLKNLLRRAYRPPSTTQSSYHFGILFPNRVGLAAGFDKNARYLNELEALGFGAVEIGTVTPQPQPGNDKPRLFRLPKDAALINRMGFNNDGVKIVTERLKQWNLGRSKIQERLVIGGNIGKNKSTPNESAWKDYEICFNSLFPWVDYFVVNVSSPNTPGLRELQDKESLRKILAHLQTLNLAQVVSGSPSTKPILLKIAPDLTVEQIDDVIALALEIKLDGILASNTTISRKNLLTDPKVVERMGAGGLSGKPVRQRSTEVVEYIFRQSGGRIPVIASGGIFTAADAAEKLDAGAVLVQVWTGFIYEGPSIVKKICQGLPGR